jgi:hypothetical protein
MITFKARQEIDVILDGKSASDVCGVIYRDDSGLIRFRPPPYGTLSIVEVAEVLKKMESVILSIE